MKLDARVHGRKRQVADDHALRPVPRPCELKHGACAGVWLRALRYRLVVVVRRRVDVVLVVDCLVAFSFCNGKATEYSRLAAARVLNLAPVLGLARDGN